MTKIAKVIVDIAHSKIDRVFDYLIDEKTEDISVGYRVLVPFRNRHIEGFVVKCSDHSSISLSRLKPIVKKLEEYPALTQEQVALAYWMKDKYACLLVDALRVMIPSQMRGNKISKKITKYVSINFDTDEIDNVKYKLKNAKKQLAIVEHLMTCDTDISTKELKKAIGASLPTVYALAEKNYIQINEKREYRQPKDEYAHTEKNFQLNNDQVYAINEINNASDSNNICKDFLIHGVTGSGKTEVYMQCSDKVIKEGKSVIILVPEISLTPQMVARFNARFKGLAAVLHSKLSAGERYDEWQRIRDGEASLIIGARSAIFAPTQNIGLIIIDEEHENTYKSETSPRYNTIEVAKQRCLYNDGVLVLGSATPTVTRYYESRHGKYNLIEMPKRTANALMPVTSIVDMREELKKGNKSIISQKLYNELSECLSRGEKAILFLNRRGHSTFVSCRDCGYVCTCEACDIPLTYHFHNNSLRCHYCNAIHTPPAVCPECNSKYIKYFGGGTQKVQNIVEKMFNGVNVLRMDADTTSGKDSHTQILNAFAKDDGQILIGTQMITKGLDFQEVTLVGIIAADASLYVSDYKATERTFQLTAQVSGRSGRGNLRGKVVIQTYSPDNFSIVHAANHDYKSFYEQEIDLRKISLFPPFAAFSRWVFSGDDESSAELEARNAYRLMNNVIKDDAILSQSIISIDVSPAQMMKIKGKYRYQLLIKYYPNEYRDDIIKKFAALGRHSLNLAYMMLEIDPNNML